MNQEGLDSQQTSTRHRFPWLHTVGRWFDGVGRLIGFIVDTITLGAIAASLLISGEVSWAVEDSPLPVPPELVMLIWFIAVYTYFSLMVAFWRKRYGDTKLSFLGWYIVQVVFRLRYPVRLMAFILLVIFGVWFGGRYTPEVLKVIGQWLFVGFMLLGWWASVKNREEEEEEARVKRAEAQATLEENWQVFEKCISERLEQSAWIDYRSISDIPMALGFDDDVDKRELERMLARYATDHPESARLGRVLDRSSGKRVSGKRPVLVNVRELSTGKYTLEGAGPV